MEKHLLRFQVVADDGKINPDPTGTLLALGLHIVRWERIPNYFIYEVQGKLPKELPDCMDIVNNFRFAVS